MNRVLRLLSATFLIVLSSCTAPVDELSDEYIIETFKGMPTEGFGEKIRGVCEVNVRRVEGLDQNRPVSQQYTDVEMRLADQSFYYCREPVLYFDSILIEDKPPLIDGPYIENLSDDITIFGRAHTFSSTESTCDEFRESIVAPETAIRFKGLNAYSQISQFTGVQLEWERTGSDTVFILMRGRSIDSTSRTVSWMIPDSGSFRIDSVTLQSFSPGSILLTCSAMNYRVVGPYENGNLLLLAGSSHRLLIELTE